MNRQEWRSQIFRQIIPSKRFSCALLCDDVARWTIIPTLRPQSVAEHSFNVAIIADAFCEELGLGRGSVIRTEAMRWAIWHDTDEIFTGDIPTPMKIQIPKHVMDAAAELSEVHTHLEECGDGLALRLVKLADIVEAYHFIKTWGVEPSKQALLKSMGSRINSLLDGGMYLKLRTTISNFMEGEDITWWMEQLTPKTRSEDSRNISAKMSNMKDSSLVSKTTLLIQHGQNSLRTSTQREKKEKVGSKK